MSLNPQSSTLNPDLASLTTPSLLWQRYAQEWVEERAREDLARSDAFFEDLPHLVCGEPLRSPTPQDVLILDRLKNPFICGGPIAEITPDHLKQFLWALHHENTPGFFTEYRFRRFLKRIDLWLGQSAIRDPQSAISEAFAFVDRVMQDAPTRKTQAEEIAEADGFRRPLGAHFLALILVPLAVEVGPVDPLDGRPWQFVPLSRIFQYLKVSAARAAGPEATDDSPHRLLEARWLAEVNETRQAGLLVGEIVNGSYIPGSRELAHVSAEQVHAAHAAAALNSQPSTPH